MLCEPHGRPFLLLPGEAVLSILCELHIVWWISVDEVIALNRNGLEVGAHKRPAGKSIAVGPEIARITDLRVSAKRHVELARSVEPAEPVEACSIEEVEQRRDLAP